MIIEYIIYQIKIKIILKIMKTQTLKQLIKLLKKIAVTAKRQNV